GLGPPVPGQLVGRVRAVTDGDLIGTRRRGDTRFPDSSRGKQRRVPLFVPRLEQNRTIEVVGNGREWPPNVAGRTDAGPSLHLHHAPTPGQVLPERDRALGQWRLAGRRA